MMKTCEICGKEIASTSQARKYCSDECRLTVKRRYDQSWLKANPGKAVEYSKKWREKYPEKARQAANAAYRKKCMAKIEAEKETLAGQLEIDMGTEEAQ